jgi:hypothetical protein
MESPYRPLGRFLALEIFLSYPKQSRNKREPLSSFFRPTSEMRPTVEATMKNRTSTFNSEPKLNSCRAGQLALPTAYRMRL